jgi:hypothetical protein
MDVCRSAGFVNVGLSSATVNRVVKQNEYSQGNGEC